MGQPFVVVSDTIVDSIIVEFTPSQVNYISGVMYGMVNEGVGVDFRHSDTD